VDRLVASLVFGRKPNQSDRPGETRWAERPWSTEDAAALVMLQQAAADHAWTGSIEFGSEGYTAHVSLSAASAPTFALAVCRAVLKAAVE
jgi:hypothetical protein